MDIINDPSMKEIVNEFCSESNDLLNQMEKLLNDFEENLELTAKLETFGQIIDRMMGAAKSLSLSTIATLCELGKTIGYKASQIKDKNLLNVVCGILFDNVEILKKMIHGIYTQDKDIMKNINLETFVGRLRWLSDKFKNIQRSSVAIDKSSMDQQSIDALLKNLGF
jgi:chemotaxis protein histidine kinase CheA